MRLIYSGPQVARQNFNFSYSSKILNSFSNTFNQGKTFFLAAKFFNHGKTFFLAAKLFSTAKHPFSRQNFHSRSKTFILAAKLSYSFNFWKHGKIFRALTSYRNRCWSMLLGLVNFKFSQRGERWWQLGWWSWQRSRNWRSRYRGLICYHFYKGFVYDEIRICLSK